MNELIIFGMLMIFFLILIIPGVIIEMIQEHKEKKRIEKYYIYHNKAINGRSRENWNVQNFYR